MTKHKPIYHARNVNRWKGLGKTSTFHRFTNPRRDKSVYIWSWGTYLLYTEYIVNMQKPLPKQPYTLIPDAVRRHQKRGDPT